MILLASLLMSCGPRLCDAQSPGAGSQEPGAGEEKARVIQKLPDGGYEVEIGGVKFRAVTDDQLRTIQERKIRLAAAEQDLALANIEIEKLKSALLLADQGARLAAAMTAIERERAGRFEALYNGEHNLRLQAELLAPRGRVSKFFDKPIVQIGIKVGLPLAGLFVRR